MKPYGLVAAASRDLDRVQPEARLASAISLANAMFTARKVFS